MCQRVEQTQLWCTNAYETVCGSSWALHMSQIQCSSIFFPHPVLLVQRWYSDQEGDLEMTMARNENDKLSPFCCMIVYSCLVHFIIWRPLFELLWISYHVIGDSYFVRACESSLCVCINKKKRMFNEKEIDELSTSNYCSATEIPIPIPQPKNFMRPSSHCRTSKKWCTRTLVASGDGIRTMTVCWSSIRPADSIPHETMTCNQQCTFANGEQLRPQAAPKCS